MPESLSVSEPRLDPLHLVVILMMSLTGAATLGEQLAEQQERWAKERREVCTQFVL